MATAHRAWHIAKPQHHFDFNWLDAIVLKAGAAPREETLTHLA